MIKKRNQSLSERKKNKSSRKNTKSQIRQTDSEENDFYTEFQAFFKNAQNIHFNKFEYMKEFFNIGITDNPTDDQIMRIQRSILSTSGWATNLKKNWTLDEKKVLIWAMGKVSEMKKEDLRDISEQSWEQISRIICRRDPDQCKQKWASMQKIALQQQPFTQEEDQRLYEIILQYQQADQGQKWSQIANDLNSTNQTYRSSKQCRERWLNHLNPNISKQPWCDEEDIQLLNFVKQQGRRWAEISKQMEGRRSENNLKNRFNSLIKREKDLTVLVFNPNIYYELERIEGIKGEDNQLYVEKLMQFTNQLGVFELMIVFKLRETYTFFQELYITTKESSIYLVQKLQLIITSEKKSHFPNNMDTYTYNFASLYGGSFILSKSEQLENVGNILQDSKESYMMTECRQTDQFIVISLKEEIQLETVMFINQELFSSTIHHFQLFGSVVYPTNEWEYLGTFIAEDNNHWQIFTLQPHFLRYLRIHINDFYSAEFHCIVTQVKVFGQTVIGDLVQSHKKNLFKLKNTNEPYQKSIQDISSLNNTYSEKTLNDEDDTMIQEYYESTSQCTYLDYFYLKTHQKQDNDKYIRIVPYAANQSVFKVTSQNILIISHNQDLQKQSINQLQFNIDQQFKITQELDKSQTKFLKEIEHQKQINIYLQDQLETYKHIFLISILIIIVINSAILIIVCNHQVISNKKFKKQTKSAISLRSNQEMYSDDDNKEIEAKTPIVKSSSSGNGNGNGNGNYINYGKNSRKK